MEQGFPICSRDRWTTRDKEMAKNPVEQSAYSRCGRAE
ncbi:uncharacterized protein PpBr36_09722 [Pyricularia pennisetigena]|nr:uncharacterized protein PpBr36_09722 [Pyricularia pennisetigena]TLS22510.1 hypothetical protein PpBr36_09722 [Pyricularia pennisetigena]